MATGELQALRHQVREAVAGIQGKLEGKPGLPISKQIEKFEAVQVRLQSAQDAVAQALAILAERQANQPEEPVEDEVDDDEDEDDDFFVEEEDDEQV